LRPQEHIKFADAAALFAFKTALAQVFKEIKKLKNLEQTEEKDYVRMAQLPPGDFIQVVNKLEKSYMASVKSRKEVAAEDAKRKAQNHLNPIPSVAVVNAVPNLQAQEHPELTEPENARAAA